MPLKKRRSYKQALMEGSFICGSSASRHYSSQFKMQSLNDQRISLRDQQIARNSFDKLPFASLSSHETEKEVKTDYAGSSLSEMPFFNIQNNDDLPKSNAALSDFNVISDNDGDYGIVHNEEENGRSDKNCSIM